MIFGTTTRRDAGSYRKKIRAGSFSSRGDLTQGMGKLLFIRGLAQVIPSPAPEDAELLLATWREQGDRLEAGNAAAERVSGDIYRACRDVLEIIHQLR